MVGSAKIVSSAHAAPELLAQGLAGGVEGHARLKLRQDLRRRIDSRIAAQGGVQQGQRVAIAGGVARVACLLSGDLRSQGFALGGPE